MLVEWALAAGADQAEAFVQQTRTTSLRVYRGDVEAFTQAETQGVGLRVVKAGSLGFSYTSEWSDAAWRNLAQEAVENARFAPPDEANGLPSAADWPRDGAELPIYHPELEAAPIQAKLDLALEAERLAMAADPRVRAVTRTSYSDRSVQVTLLNSLGISGQYRANHAVLSVGLMAEAAGQAQTGSSFRFGRALGELAPEQIAQEAAERATALLSGKPVASQEVPVIFDRYTAAQLMGHLARALSADAVQRGRSLFAGKVEQRVASPDVTLVDDGRLLAGPDAAPFDDEGVPTQRHELVAQGRLTGYLHNTYTARKAGAARSTGNGLRGSFRGTPEVSHSNFFLAPGADSLQDLIRPLPSGFYVLEVSGLSTGGLNIVSGDLSVGAAGIWIEHGELARPVREVTIAGNLIDLLHAIDAVGDDLTFVGSSGAPSFRVKKMAISGRGA